MGMSEDVRATRATTDSDEALEVCRHGRPSALGMIRHPGPRIHRNEDGTWVPCDILDGFTLTTNQQGRATEWVNVPSAPDDRAEADALAEAAALKRNTIIHGDAPPKRFFGEWVAVPREDFDNLRAALARYAARREQENG